MNKNKKKKYIKNTAYGVGSLAVIGTIVANKNNIGKVVRKLYDSSKRVGKKRGSYNKSSIQQQNAKNLAKQSQSKYEVWDSSSIITSNVSSKTSTSVSKPPQQLLLPPASKSPKQVSNSAKIARRKEILGLSEDKSKADSNLRQKFNKLQNLNKRRKKSTDGAYIQGVEIRRIKAKTQVKNRVDKLKNQGLYKRHIFLMSEFTLN